MPDFNFVLTISTEHSADLLNSRQSCNVKCSGYSSSVPKRLAKCKIRRANFLWVRVKRKLINEIGATGRKKLSKDA